MIANKRIPNLIINRKKEESIKKALDPQSKKYADPRMLDQKSNVWGSVFLWLNIVLNLNGWL